MEKIENRLATIDTLFKKIPYHRAGSMNINIDVAKINQLLQLNWVELITKLERSKLT